MKKSILLSLIVVSTMITSCKKAYTCECIYKVTASASGVDLSSSTSSQEYSEKMKEKQAKSACSESQKQLEALPVDQSLTRTATCAVKY